MNILFLTSAHNSLSQRLLIELTDRGHRVSVALATSNEAMITAVAQHIPDLIIAPMLKVAIPDAIWSQHKCLIVHPGIKGDRGPSSLDWAIAAGEQSWGVSILEAVAEFDAGPIWATHEFPIEGQSLSKSSLYRHQVTEAAVRGVLEAVAKFESGELRPERLDYSKPGTNTERGATPLSLSVAAPGESTDPAVRWPAFSALLADCLGQLPGQVSENRAEDHRCDQ